MKKTNWTKYIISLVITAGIFGVVFFVSNLANQKRVEEMIMIQQKITIDLLSSETQFALLKEASCTQDVSSMLTSEINRLSERLGYMEEQFGATNKDVINLKMNYSLLLIKDYLLLGELSKKCNYKPTVIMYFYNTTCEECRKQGYVLTALREKYPDVRVYAFDADLPLSAIKTLIDMYHIGSPYPALILNDRVVHGYKTIEEIEQLVPELAKRVKDAKRKELLEQAKSKIKTPIIPTSSSTSSATTSPSR